MLQALPPTLFTMLLELAAGGWAVLVLLDLRHGAPRGFRLLTGSLLWLAALGALWVRGAFPPSHTWPYAATETMVNLERVLLWVLLAVLTGYLAVTYGTSERPTRRASLGAVACVLPLLPFSGLVQGGPQLHSLAAPLSLLVGGLALGAAVVGLVLGHWYLITPLMSSRPLVEVAQVLATALVIQVGLLPVLLLTSPAVDPITRMGELAVFFWLRVAFGMLMPLGMSLMVLHTARRRSMQSATGLLYLVVSLVFAGEVVSRSIFFHTGQVV